MCHYANPAHAYAILQMLAACPAARTVDLDAYSLRPPFRLFYLHPDTREFWRLCFTDEGPLNLLGRIALSPLTFTMGITWSLMDILFTKRR